ncbi:hypothetical protein [uncultured Veillonella sp.]|uniref:hypothetical protein n=1 Tax=uncultured Veillonella sp. TaxID=159268 RepID=UPI0025DA7B5B|nr:hypothetical protein [uncultured Veillonella sp.]
MNSRQRQRMKAYEILPFYRKVDYGSVELAEWVTRAAERVKEKELEVQAAIKRIVRIIERSGL